ncbi:MAG: 5-formyltetrahydrofolate cyclo-ligase [Candidatus Bathyarchaeia archaeon]
MTKTQDAKLGKREVRASMWRLLEERDVARFPLPITGRIPNFAGADEAAKKLARTTVFQRADTVKVNPDAPQRWVRLMALEAGKRVYVPSPRLRSGFLLLHPREIPKSKFLEASSIRGAFKYGRTVSLRGLEAVDLVVMGCVAVTASGARLGKGGGYSEIEYAVLSELGLLQHDVPVVTTVHDLQVVEQAWPTEAHDVVVDVICTPTATIETARHGERPTGILWERITEEKLRSMPILSELRSREHGPLGPRNR